MGIEESDDEEMEEEGEQHDQSDAVSMHAWLTRLRLAHPIQCAQPKFSILQVPESVNGRSKLPESFEGWLWVELNANAFCGSKSGTGSSFA